MRSETEEFIKPFFQPDTSRKTTPYEQHRKAITAKQAKHGVAYFDKVYAICSILFS